MDREREGEREEANGSGAPSDRKGEEEEGGWYGAWAGRNPPPSLSQMIFKRSLIGRGRILLFPSSVGGTRMLGLVFRSHDHDGPLRSDQEILSREREIGYGFQRGRNSPSR